MLYFDTLPKIFYTDGNGVTRIMTNIMARASILPEILKSPMLYYQYYVQDLDTPEIIAHKYYGDSYRYWIVLFANQLLDPQWNWPLSSRDFNRYIQSKYPTEQEQVAIHHYEKILTQYDENTNITTINTIKISEQEYNNTIENTKSFELPTGPASVTTTKRTVSVYEYEFDLNEEKRNINILNSTYVDEMEKQFKLLMAP